MRTRLDGASHISTGLGGGVVVLGHLSARSASISASVDRRKRHCRNPLWPDRVCRSGRRGPVLVIHGAGGGFDQGLELSRPLASRGCKVIAISRFGCLRTPLPMEPSPAAQADAHAQLIDALGISRVAILGASARGRRRCSLPSDICGSARRLFYSYRSPWRRPTLQLSFRVYRPGRKKF